ncbi:FAD-dependent oxidoreductase [Acidimicrobiia bacterium EGI L10123]|uniref:protoporphyrinogen/coproporphyrinogen oxidase n=1 Tax=Salinilacustrithrix flava TaxID=2957203 RepID=UPI003D7C3552|nr:FAD-dependent oxidoreductase [Acidimicrobiia bacterium EGI L10123]
MHVVIGAGPAGLAAAWQLRRDGHEVRVLEASDHVGGMAGVREVAGVRVDLGSHRLHPSTPPWLLDELGQLVELQERPRNGRIRMGGRWVPFPLTPMGLVRGLPARVAARAALDAAVAPLRRPKADTYAEVVRAGLGPTVWRRFHEPYAWKLWDTDPDLLAGELARRRVSASSPVDIARRLARGVRSRPTFLYPRRGFGAIAEALAAQVPVDTGRRVNRVIEHHDRVIVGLSDGRLVTASHVHATVPAWRVASWLGLHEDPVGPPPVRAMVLVYLVLDRRPYTPFDAHYLPDRNVLLSRLSEPANYRDSAEDPTDRTVLCAEIPCWQGDDVWSAGDDALGARVADDLVRSGLPDPRHVAVHVERLPSVYPVMTPQSLGALARAERALTMSTRVTVLGRQGLATPDNTHHVLEMGVRSARCVRPDGTFDHAAWAEARDAFRSYVVED